MNYVIIGNSAAAIGCVQGIRSLDRKGKITVISDEKYHTYSRPLISYWLKGAVEEENMLYRDKDFYVNNGVETLLDSRISEIIPSEKLVRLTDGKEISYDKLLNATGSRPFIPPMDGLDKVKNRFTFMKLDDVKAIRAAVKPKMKILIIGAGLIGLKAAEALEHYDADMTVIDLADRILPSILDSDASSLMQTYIEKRGVKFILGTSVKSFSENSAVLANGEEIKFDMVITAVGVRPNTELIKSAGGEVNRGIITDNRQAVKGLSDIYAAGDCTESNDITTGTSHIIAILPNAFAQGEAAGKNMAGAETSADNLMPMNAIGFFGLHIITAGSYEGESYVEKNEAGYKRLITENNRLKGFILVGNIDKAGIYTSLTKQNIGLDKVNFDLLKKAPQLLAFSRERRNEKLAGGVGNVS